MSGYYRGEDEDNDYKRAFSNTWWLRFWPNSVTEILIVFLTHSFPMHPFSTRWKHHLTVFWWFQGVEKGCIANKWVKFETGYYLYSFSNRILTRGTQSINYVPINSVHTWKNKSFFFALKRIASCGNVYWIWKWNFFRATLKLACAISYLFTKL